MIRMYFQHWSQVPKELFEPYPNFSIEGDRPYSPDDGSFLYDQDLLHRLQLFRDDTGVPARTNSWYRSKLYNARLPRSAPLSEHTLGKAVDVSTRGKNHALYLRAALRHFSGIGLYHSTRMGQFMHLDTGMERMWFGDQQSKEFWMPLLKS